MAQGMNNYQRAVRSLDSQIEEMQSRLEKTPKHKRQDILNIVQHLTVARQVLQELKEENCELRNIIRTNNRNQDVRGSVSMNYE